MVDNVNELIATLRTMGAELARITQELQKYREDCKERDQRFRNDMAARAQSMAQDAPRKFLDNQVRRRGDQVYAPPKTVVRIRHGDNT